MSIAIVSFTRKDVFCLLKVIFYFLLWKITIFHHHLGGI